MRLFKAWTGLKRDSGQITIRGDQRIWLVEQDEQITDKVQCFKPGDIVLIQNGDTLEIGTVNTDARVQDLVGRLIR